MHNVYRFTYVIVLLLARMKNILECLLGEGGVVGLGQGSGNPGVTGAGSLREAGSGILKVVGTERNIGKNYATLRNHVAIEKAQKEACLTQVNHFLL